MPEAKKFEYGDEKHRIEARGADCGNGSASDQGDMGPLRRCGRVWYDKKASDGLPTVRTCRRLTRRSSASCRRCADELRYIPAHDGSSAER